MANRISVLIPVFNRRHMVGDAIQSALAEDIDGLNVVVVDNCSDDGTWEFLQSLRDSRLSIHRNDRNVGLFGNFDRCGELATGDFSIFLCSDDRLVSGYLAHAVAQLRNEPSTVLFSSGARVIDESGRERQTIAKVFPAGQYEGSSLIPAWFWTHFNYGANPLNYPSGVIFKTSALKQCLPFRAQLRTIADIDMYFRVARLGDFRISHETGCYVMHHADQIGRVARASGELIRNELALLAEFKEELQKLGIYGAVSRQMSTSALASVLHLARSDPGAAYRLYRALGRNIFQMAGVAAKSLTFIALRKLVGYTYSPYLKPVSGPSGE